MKSISYKRSFVILAALGGTVLSTASVAHASPPYSYIGCYADESTRDLPYQFGGNDPEMTLQLCASICAETGVPYFGVQDGDQCFCGGSYGRYGMSTNCNMACSGESSQTCGGSGANSVYQNKFVPPGGFMGCFADSATRDMSFLFSTNSPGMTVEECRSSCYVLGYTYAGLQYGDQCWCGDSYGSQGKSTSCGAQCTGNSEEVCGGTYANDVWTSSAPSGYVGCFADSTNRDLPVQIQANGNGSEWTVEQCRSTCNAWGYTHAGLQAGLQCWCGDDYGGQGTSTACTMACNGNNAEVCGGDWANAIYQSADVPLPGSNLQINTTLYAGNKVFSPSGRLYLTMQTDGNLVLYFTPFGTSVWSQALWASGTEANPGAYAFFQPDGNLVVYSSSGNALWATGTNGKGSSSVAVQDDGNLVVYNSGNSPLWATNTYNLVPDSAHCLSDFCPAGTWWSTCFGVNDFYEDIYGDQWSVPGGFTASPDYGTGTYPVCRGHAVVLGGVSSQWQNYFSPSVAKTIQTCKNSWGTLECSPNGPSHVDCENCD